MLSVQLIGQMGNQYFEVAACIGLANTLGVEYHIPDHTMNNTVWKPHLKHLANSRYNPELSTTLLREKSHSFQDLPSLYDSRENVNVLLSGYFQSKKYFEHCLPEIRKAFGFDYTVKKLNTCCIHVRRGDYLLYPDKHPVVSKKYLRDAILSIASNDVINFCFFSDDITWCRDFVTYSLQLGVLEEKLLFEFSEGKTELEDFQLMLECGNFIISNSTFSLMAAILSESSNKIVISPDESNWFGSGNSHLDVSDLIPKEFIRIKY